MHFPPVVYHLYLVYRALALLVRQNQNSIITNLASRTFLPFLHILTTIRLPLE